MSQKKKTMTEPRGLPERQKVMWAVQHVLSGSWHRGDSNLLLYWAEHEARIACAVEYHDQGLQNWKPVKVKVMVCLD